MSHFKKSELRVERRPNHLPLFGIAPTHFNHQPFQSSVLTRAELIKKVCAELETKKHELDQILRFFESQTKTDIEAATLQNRNTAVLESNCKIIGLDRRTVKNVSLLGVTDFSTVALQAFVNNFCDIPKCAGDNDDSEDYREFYETGYF